MTNRERIKKMNDDELFDLILNRIMPNGKNVLHDNYNSYSMREAFLKFLEDDYIEEYK